MAHGERAKRLANNRGKDYYAKRLGNFYHPPVPTCGHSKPISVKKMTHRRERRNQKLDEE